MAKILTVSRKSHHPIETLYNCNSRDLIGLAALVNEPLHHAHFRVAFNLIMKARLSVSYCDLPALARRRSASVFIYLFTLRGQNPLSINNRTQDPFRVHLQMVSGR